MKLITIIVFLIPVVVARHNHRTVLESILKSKDNLYAKVDNDVQNVMNNLFDDLNLAPTFLAKSRIKLMLRMHYDLNNMAEKNYDVFEKMIEAARPSTGNGSSKGLALFKLIEKTLDDEFFNISKNNNNNLHKNPIDDTIEKKAATKSSETDTSVENISPSDTVFADSKEFKKFIKDFIKKIDKLNETDFSKSTPLLPPIEEDTTQPYNEFWEPPPLLDQFNETRRIFKGKRSRAKTYPFVASIHLLETFVCAGSIVSSDLILTAASCLQILHNNRFFRENPKAVFVRIGSDYFNRRGEMIPIFESFFHPAYNPKNLANNLVLLRLVRRISFKRKEGRVKKIKYDRTPESLSVNTNGIIVLGWGSRKRNNVIDQYERVMAARLDVYQLEECAQVYSRQYVTNKHFCAGFIATGGGACNKDLGGPGVVGGVLVGVISFGAPLCGAIDAPTVFTKLGHYAKWIDSIVAEEGPSLAARTTLSHGHGFRYFVDPEAPPPDSPYKTTRGFIEPPLMYSEEFKHVVRRRTSPRTLFDQLFPNTPTTRFPIVLPIQLLRSWLYDDYGLGTEEVNDMFKTTRKLENAIEHPLVNKSLFSISGVNDKSTQKKKYSTIRLTTAGGKGLSPEPETRTPFQLTTRRLLTTTIRIIDLLTEGSVTGIDPYWTTKKLTPTTEPTTATSEGIATAPVTEPEPEPAEPEPEYIYYSKENLTLRFRDYYN